MSEKDVVSKDYLRNKERFADIINNYQFHGRQVIRPADIHECDPQKSMPRAGSDGIARMSLDYESSQAVSLQKKSIVVTGDVSRKVSFQMKAAIVTMEEQSDIHYAMPVRVMVEDGANYHEQWNLIKKEHREKKDLQKDRAEFLSGFAKEDRLVPVYTIVLYFGEKPWQGPRCLKDLLDLEGLPAEIIEAVADYPLHILDVRRFEDYELFQTDLKLLFGFLQRDKDQKALRKYVEENRDGFSDLAEDTYDMISQFSHARELDKKKFIYRKKGKVDMCKALEDMNAMSREEGQKIGLEEGQKIGLEEGQKIGRREGREEGQKIGQELEQCRTIRSLKANMSVAQMVALLKYEESFVLRVLNLDAKCPQSTDEEILKEIAAMDA